MCLKMLLLNAIGLLVLTELFSCQQYDFGAEISRQCLVPDPVGLLDCVENKVTLPYLTSWVDCTNSLGENVKTSADIINYRCKSVWEGKGVIQEVFYIKDCVIEKTGLPAKNVSAEVLGAYKECEKTPTPQTQSKGVKTTPIQQQKLEVSGYQKPTQTISKQALQPIQPAYQQQYFALYPRGPIMQQQTFPPIGRQQMNAGFLQTQISQLAQQQVPAFPSQIQQNTNAQFTQQQINTGSLQTQNPQLVQQQVPAFPSQTQPISKAPFAQQQINAGTFQTTNPQMVQQQVPAFSSQTQQTSNTPYAQQIQGGSNQGRHPQQGLQQQPIAAFQQQGAYYGVQQQATPQQGHLYSSQQIQQGRLSYYPTMQQMPMFVQPIATQPVNAFGPNQQTQFYAATPMQQFNYAPNPQPYYYNFQIRQPASSSIKS